MLDGRIVDGHDDVEGDDEETIGSRGSFEDDSLEGLVDDEAPIAPEHPVPTPLKQSPGRDEVLREGRIVPLPMACSTRLFPRTTGCGGIATKSWSQSRLHVKCAVAPVSKYQV